MKWTIRIEANFWMRPSAAFNDTDYDFRYYCCSLFFRARFCFGWFIAISTTCAIFRGAYVGLPCHLTLFQDMLSSACVYVLMQLRRSFLQNCLELLAGVRSVRCGWRSPAPRLQFAEPWVSWESTTQSVELSWLARRSCREPEEC